MTPAGEEREASGPPAEPPADGGGAQKALQVLAIAFVFPVAIYVGFLGGRWLGGQLGAAAAGGLVGALLGAIAGFWELYRFVRRLWPR